MKKPIALFTIADKNHFPYVVKMLKSFRHFHDWDVILYTNETKPENLKQLPKNVKIEDLTPLLADPMFFYRATPLLGEPLLDEYECVVKADADQIIVGDLSYLTDTTDYDVATVINWNRFDPQYFGFVELGRIGIFPAEYFNCGFVVMRNKKFVHQWMVSCFTTQFDRMQYKEQDILNILCYFGNYNVRCLDHPDIVSQTQNKAFWGIIGKGEWCRAVVEKGKVIIKKGLGDTPFPPDDLEIKILHMGGGNSAKKDNWGAFCSPPLMEWISKVTK